MRSLLLLTLLSLLPACQLPTLAGGGGAPGGGPASQYSVFEHQASMQCGSAMYGVPQGSLVHAAGKRHPAGEPETKNDASAPARSRKGVPAPRVPPRSVHDETNAGLFAVLRKRSPRFRVTLDGPRVAVEGASGAEVDEVRLRIEVLMVLNSAALRASQSCHVFALQNAMGIELTAMYGQNITDLAVEREASKRVIAQVRRADSWAASAVALVALYQAAAAGGDVAVLDRTAQVAVEQFNAPLGTATADEVAALWGAGRQKAMQLDKWSRTWGPREGIHGERQRRGLLGLQEGGRSSPDLPSEPRMELTGDANEVTSALIGLAKGDVGAVIRGAALLFPKDSPIRAGLRGAGALVQGDFVVALQSAAELVPKDSALGSTLALANQAVAVAKAAGG